MLNQNILIIALLSLLMCLRSDGFDISAAYRTQSVRAAVVDSSSSTRHTRTTIADMSPRTKTLLLYGVTGASGVIIFVTIEFLLPSGILFAVPAGLV